MRIAPLLLLLAAAGCVTSGGPRGTELLPLVDVKKDAIEGAWTVEDGALVSPAVQFGRIQVRCTPPEEYELEAEVVRVKGNNSLALGLRLGGKLFAVMLDSHPGPTSGIDQVGKAPFYDNATTKKGKLFENGKAAVVRVAVRKDRVTVTVDGRPAVDWAGDPAKVDLFPLWKIRDPKGFFVGSWETVYRINRLTLIP